jgi:branched-chain amino acid transport system substrate-binding protein
MAQAYAGGLVVQHCIETAGTLNQQVLREVASRLDFTTFYGRFRIDPSTGRQVGHRMPVVQWQEGRKVVVWPR